jgi:hypothetical protein
LCGGGVLGDFGRQAPGHTERKASAMKFIQ